MNLMVAPLCYILLVIPLSFGQDELANDSLKSALEAISRRQRDLASPGGGYYGGSSLSQYHYPDRENEDQLSFLAPPRDFTGDGQPENIGYGYQKSVPSQSGMFPSSQLIGENVMDHHPSANNKALEKLLVEYLEDEYKNDNTADDAYYHHGHEQDKKRSSFRERGSDLISDSRDHFRPNVIGRLEAMRKRGDRLHSMVPSSFRERVHSRLVGDDNLEAEKRWYDFAEDLAKEVQDEREELIEQEREDRGEEDDSQKYLDLLESLWEKFKKSKPDVVDIEDLTSGDVQEILSSLDNDDIQDEDDVRKIKTEPNKRQYGGSYGGGYDIFNNGGGMGGWAAGGSYRKRGKQRLDGNNEQQGNFLYSLKFVSPATNREAVETLKDDSIELPDERDEDILRLTSSGFNRHEPESWIPTYEHEEPIDEVYGPNEENYQRLIMSQGGPNSASSSRKRVSSLITTTYGLRELPPPGLLIPDRHLEKKMMYESAMKRKRYPVTKRSSNFYTSPPLLHHKSFSSTDNLKEIRKKKDASIGNVNSVTDPKVARELNQIFSSSVANEELSEESMHAPKPAGVGTPATKSESKIEQDSTTHTSVIPNIVVNNSSSSGHPEVSTVKGHVDQKTNNESSKLTQHNDKEHLNPKNQEQPLREDETVEQPITMSRIQTPLEIKKKSIDWSDYFGIDRRRKKTGPININELEGSGDGTAIDDDWLLNQYYKTLALSTNPVKKRISLHNHALPQSKDKKQNDNQPFDTRIFNADIFSRSAQREATKKSNQHSDPNDESRIENMDTKLRNIEDLIVNEAVKYTGAHEGTTDPKEIQEVKDKIMSRLAAAYSLEKMRLALGEFKSSLQAQKMSKYNPENQKSSLVADEDEDKKKKRVAVKKEKAEEKKKEEGKEDEKKKRDEHEKESEDEENSGEFLQGPVEIEPMSEAYMGQQQPSLNHEECPVLEHILRKCRYVGTFSGDSGQIFLPLCSLHQICYLCGPEVGSPSSSACDLMFLTEADAMCMGDQLCQRAARRSVMTLRQSQPDISPSGSDEHCSNNSCIARYFLTSPLPNNQAR